MPYSYQHENATWRPNPSSFDPSLHQNRIKRDIIVERKLGECPEGLGIEGLPYLDFVTSFVVER
jgi:hypothetical protein